MLAPQSRKHEIRSWGANPKKPRKNQYQQRPQTVRGDWHGPWWTATGRDLGFLPWCLFPFPLLYLLHLTFSLSSSFLSLSLKLP